MTKDRIWHVSKNFAFPVDAGGEQPEADDPQEYGQDNEHVNRDTDRGNRNTSRSTVCSSTGFVARRSMWKRY